MPVTSKTVTIIGVPIDLGAGRRGVDMGPSAIRVAEIDERLQLLGFKVVDCGDVVVRIPETEPMGNSTLRYKKPILAACKDVMRLVRTAMKKGQFPLVLGGDHSLSIGSLAGSAAHFHDRDQHLGVIWFDAHGDFNTPATTPSGNIHGMALAVGTGRGNKDLVQLGGFAPKVRAKNVVILGARDLDPLERESLRKSQVTVFTMRDLDERGMRDVMEQAMLIASDGTDGIHLSFDLDVIDPEFAPGTGTPVRGGVYYREGHLAMEMLGDRAQVVSMDLVEVNPILDSQNQTAILGVELVMSLMGKRIY